MNSSYVVRINTEQLKERVCGVIKIESNISDLLKKQKVYIIWRTEKKTKMLEEYTETTLIEIYSDVNRAWDVAVELNEKAKGKTSYSIEVWEVQ